MDVLSYRKRVREPLAPTVGHDQTLKFQGHKTALVFRGERERERDREKKNKKIERERERKREKERKREGERK